MEMVLPCPHLGKYHHHHNHLYKYRTTHLGFSVSCAVDAPLHRPVVHVGNPNVTTVVDSLEISVYNVPVLAFPYRKALRILKTLRWPKLTNGISIDDG